MQNYLRFQKRGKGIGFGKYCLIIFSFIIGIVNAKAQDGIWTTKADIPTPRGMHSSSVVDDIIYAIGGIRALENLPLSTVEAYDPGTNAWETKDSMSIPRANLSTCVVDSIIYVIGGSSLGIGLATLEAYSPVTNTWTTKTSMPTPRGYLSASAVDGIIYVIGGISSIASGTTVTSKVEAYNPKTDTWTEKADMKTARGGLSACVVDGIIYAIGGTITGISICKTVEAYDPATDTWTIKADMPTARSGLTTFVIDGKIYAVGGVAYGGGPGLSTVEVYDPVTNIWTTQKDMPIPRRYMSCSMVDGKIYAIGGLDDKGRGIATVEEYNPAYYAGIVEDEITSISLQGNFIKDPATRKMMIYLPPSYVKGGNFPVVYLLHGTPVSETAYLNEQNWLNLVGTLLSEGPDFPENGFKGMIDSLIAQGKMKEMIIVMPDAGCTYTLSWYSNSVLNGNYEDYIVNDLVSYIDSHYRTIPNRDNRAIVGHCMGGYGAMKLAMKHPDVFGMTAGLSAPLMLDAIKARIPMIIAENPDSMMGPQPDKILTSFIYSCAAAWSPNINNPPFNVDLPFEYPSGVIIDSVWNKWLEHDLFTMITKYSDNLKKLRSLYFDCGDQVEMKYNLLMEPFHQALTAAGIKHDYEIYTGGTHCNKLYSRLANSLSNVITGVGKKDESNVPLAFSLYQNYPNPFNPITTIKYTISSRQFVTLKVFDILGREVAILVNEEKPAGTYETTWNTASAGGRLSSGVYIYQLKATPIGGQAGSYFETKKMLLLK